MSAATVTERPLASLEEARAQILAGVAPKPTEDVDLPAALGRVLAAPVVARLTLPPWDNSAMDGFAVRAADVAGARPASPVSLPVAGDLAAGAAATAALAPGTAQRIFTGAPLPPGADAVVPVEDTDAPRGTAGGGIAPERVAVSAAARVGAHIRPAGSDIQAGARLLEPGRRLNATALALAAAGGHARLPVFERPRVAVLATGDELAAAGAALGPAQIPDSNSIGLTAQATQSGAEARSWGVARDNLEEVTQKLGEAIGWADLVVVSGGVSVGAHDVVKDAFERLGRLELWRVAVQPGKPVAFGRADGRRQVLLFGLPGNPVSSFVTFELFVRPVLRRLAGFADLSGREIVRARLSEAVTKPVDRRTFLRVRLAGGEARLSGGQGSHMLSGLAAANALAIVPEGISELPAGAEVDVMRLDSELDG
jgi:molybdopterin molybdotransferase